jgi:hypothetical protein
MEFDATEWKKVEVDVPWQQNAYGCGVSSCMSISISNVRRVMTDLYRRFPKVGFFFFCNIFLVFDSAIRSSKNQGQQLQSKSLQIGVSRPLQNLCCLSQPFKQNLC